MSMITELVKRLKDLYVDAELDMLCGVDGECRQVIKESAQVIEELSAKLQSANMERSSQYYNGGWIPVSERLPASDEDVLVTNGKGMYVGWINLADKIWRVDSESEYFMYDIVAWMPLPESYRGDKDGNINNKE